MPPKHYRIYAGRGSRTVGECVSRMKDPHKRGKSRTRSHIKGEVRTNSRRTLCPIQAISSVTKTSANSIAIRAMVLDVREGRESQEYYTASLTWTEKRDTCTEGKWLSFTVTRSAYVCN